MTDFHDDFVYTEETSVPNVEELNYLIGAKNFNIVLLNVRSLNRNFNNLEVFIERFTIKPDIIVCTETWLLHDYNCYNLKNYKIFYNN